MKILDNRQLDLKLDRLAYEILERNLDEKNIYFLGINNNGLRFAKLLHSIFIKLTDQTAQLGNIQLNAADPTKSEIKVNIPLKDLNNSAVIIVDDVANTGRTIFYATRPLMDILPSKVEAAVLVDRKHKSFPVKVDYVGLSLATTLKENIRVDLLKKTQKSVYLE